MLKKITTCLVLSGVALQAQALDFQSSRTLSLSQGGRGGAVLNDAITLNPSSLGFQQAQGLSGTFNWASTPSVSQGSDRNMNISVVDGHNQYVGAGISYTRKPGIDVIHLALAKKVFDGVSLGAHGKRYSTRNNNASAVSQSSDGIDGGASISFALQETPVGQVQLGLTSDNLRHTDKDEKYFGPRQLGAGAKISLNSMLMLYSDYVQNFSREKGSFPIYSGGAEVALGSDLFVRGGMYGFRETGWSAGGGWIGPKLGVSYGYQTRKAEAERGFQHAVTMDVYM